MTPIYAILTTSPEERENAQRLQEALTQMFGVRLPINPDGVAVGPNTGNVVLLGKAACGAAGRVDDEELYHVGRDGFVINAYQRTIAIAGENEEGTARGVARYLEDHGLRIVAPGRVRFPNLRNEFMHELYLLDWPHFRDAPIADIWQFTTSAGQATTISGP